MSGLDWTPDEPTTNVEIVPEGERILTVWNWKWGKHNANPKGRRSINDFSRMFYPEFVDYETGLLVSAFDCRVDGNPFFRNGLRVFSVGNLSTRDKYFKLLAALQCQPYNAGNAKKFFPENGYDHPTAKGVLGMPLKVNIVHLQYHRRSKDPDPNATPNRAGYYEWDDYPVLLDEEGNALMATIPAIVTDHPGQAAIDEAENGYELMVTSGWPILLPLTDDEKKIRNRYFVEEEEQNGSIPDQTFDNHETGSDDLVPDF